MIQTVPNSRSDRGLLTRFRDLPLLRTYPYQTFCALILVVMAINLFSALTKKSLTNDETVHIPAGYYYLLGGDFHINPEHPPLIKMWAALPLLAFKPRLQRPVATNVEPQTLISSVRFWNINKNRFREISLWARVPVVLLTLLLGVSIFLYCRKLFGPRAAVFAVFLFSLEPTMLAHGIIVHTDLPSALALVLFMFALHVYWRTPTLRKAVVLGAATALALLTKYSLLIVLPVLLIALVYVIVRAPHFGNTRRQSVVNLCVVIVVTIFLLNAAYGFQNPPLSPNDLGWIDGNPVVFSTLLQRLVKLRLLVIPSYYMFGFYSVGIHNQGGHPTSLLGAYNSKGWWYYFPTVLALKTTIPFLLLSVASFGWALWEILAKRKTKLLVVILPIVVYMAISMTSNINIGVRHLAPVFPFMFIVTGVMLDRLTASATTRRVALVVIPLFFIWMTVITFRIYPDYLSYVNALSGGKQNWQVMSDSNVEWGGDVAALADYLQAHGETSVDAALAAGWVTLELYGIHYVNLFAPAEVKQTPTKYVAIGASFLNGSTVPPGLDRLERFRTDEERVNFFKAYRAEQPVAVFGNSIYLYYRRD